MRNIGAYSLYLATGAGSSATIPLPTAYGLPSSYIIMLDSLSVYYSATGVGTASAGGNLRCNVRVNGTTNTNNILAQCAPVSWYTSGTATSGILQGGFILQGARATAMWARTTAGLSDPSIPVTSNQFQIGTNGTFPASDAVEWNITWHYEDPAQARG